MHHFLDSVRFGLRFILRSYTDQAVEVLLAARKHAAVHRRDIDPEHVLFGLAQLSRAVALVALKNLGLDLGCEGESLTALTDHLPPRSWGSSPSLDTRTEQLLSRAEGHARGLGLKYVGSEHLVLGLLQGTGPSAEYLRERGITPERFLAELKSLFAGFHSAGEP